MKKIFFLIAAIVLIACQETATKSEEVAIPETQKQTSEFAIVIHGGAGTIKKENMTPELERQYNDKLTEAVKAGHDILKNGGDAMDAVEASIRIMEDSPLFNSGKGAVFTHDGINSLDASFMDGKTLNAGAVAGITTVKNPISLARKVMTHSEHVLLSGSGGDAFAKALHDPNIEIVPNSYFFTENRFQSLQRVLKREVEKEEAADKKVALLELEDPFIKNSKYGTVGCVALDKNGNIAAGTSTGGMTNKKYGRIGDSPIIGSGTYANNATCGVSSTGHGEYFIRAQVAYDISAMMEYKGLSLKEATDVVIQKKLVDLGGTGGIVALDHLGNVSMEFNTAGMYRATMNDKDELIVGMYKE
ncbi:isoaspartyl peptidase/L-asparaginase family protein [Nonlabens ulvanivorans]|uniref:isoaspartyl peptidase/L-asparaginase family protein n=1 Tax=Nonlabens ulvanivorans TaxID=906888 RepID=UPI002942660F|nr:isoaspartyl peptidase/L-asparaginase [Nonlabens ulvanivorans]WOI22250.1 isoaspartyl peptidase/L-asparaginase [Nonlabens ulvanivorans]